MFSKYSFIILCSLCILQAACTKTNTVQVKKPSGPNLEQFIGGNYSFSIFHHALRKTGLDKKIASDTFTVLVPDDAAFGRIGVHNPKDLDQLPPDYLKRWTEYHITPGKTTYYDVQQLVDNAYLTIAGDTLFFSKPYRINYNSNGEEIRDFHINGDTVVATDQLAGNGVVHILQRPLQIPQGNIRDFLQNDPGYSMFVAALKKFGLFDQLDQAGQFTVFAPGNDAFTNRGITEADIAGWDISRYDPYLFDCYIFRNTRMFISDFWDARSGNTSPAENSFMGTGGVVAIPPAVPLRVMAYLYCLPPAPPVSCFRSTRQTLAYVTENDHYLQNGLVHRLDDLVVLPEDMLKN